jgi:hypothetical protein
MADEGLVRIYASADAMDARMMRGRLETEGVSVMVKGETEGPYRMGAAYLWVPAEQADAAREIVDAVRSGAFALQDDADVNVGNAAQRPEG